MGEAEEVVSKGDDFKLGGFLRDQGGNYIIAWSELDPNRTDNYRYIWLVKYDGNNNTLQRLSLDSQPAYPGIKAGTFNANLAGGVLYSINDTILVRWGQFSQITAQINRWSGWYASIAKDFSFNTPELLPDGYWNLEDRGIGYSYFDGNALKWLSIFGLLSTSYQDNTWSQKIANVPYNVGSYFSSRIYYDQHTNFNILFKDSYGGNRDFTFTSIWTADFLGDTWASLINLDGLPLDVSGTIWGDGSTISSDYPSQVVDSFGDKTVVWARTESEDFNAIYFIWSSRFEQSKGQWSTAMRISNVGSEKPAIYQSPAAIADSAGNVIAVWPEKQTTDTYKNLVSAVFNKQLNTWATQQEIENQDIGDTKNFKLISGSDNVTTVIWEQDNGTTTDIWYNQYSSGVWLGSKILIAGKAGLSLYLRDAVTLQTGESVIFWTEMDGSFNAKHWATTNQNGEWQSVQMGFTQYLRKFIGSTDADNEWKNETKYVIGPIEKVFSLLLVEKNPGAGTVTVYVNDYR